MPKGKNTHLEHLEDSIINEGKTGGEEAIEILKYLGSFLSGSPAPGLLVTTKWDGAPAIVCGIDPSDNQFFVGTKSVFAQDAKICKTEQDIRKWYSGALAEKLSAALTYLPQCGITGVLQGDLMFTNDKQREKIDGMDYITFRPNTITYAVVPDSPLGQKINRASLGIVFHTKYTGPSLPEMKASFSINDRDFRSTTQVWAEKAEFKDISGVASMNPLEKDAYDKLVRKTEGSLKKTGTILNRMQTGKKTLAIDTELKKFFNNYVKKGQNIPSVDRAYLEFATHLGKEYSKVVEKHKTLKAQADKAGKFIEAINFISDNEREFKMMIATYMNLISAKQMLVDKMKRVGSLRLFVSIGGDYQATSPEGFVAIKGSTATKIIDRLEFSRLNFTVDKIW